jgi:hypothetical protein
MEGGGGYERRRVLGFLAACGIALPAGYLSKAGPASAYAEAGGAPATDATVARAAFPIVREFADPLLELTRLMRRAAEIEHALLVQYMYAAFALRPAYEDIGGIESPSRVGLMGVALDKMMQFGTVNNALVMLGAAPHMTRRAAVDSAQGLPCESGPEPLSRPALARLVRCEAPAGLLERAEGDSPEARVARGVEASIGVVPSSAGAGRVYGQIIAVLDEIGAGADRDLKSRAHWQGAFRESKRRGETDHFPFVRDLFLGSHESFGGRDPWVLPMSDPAYPSYRVPTNPTAFAGRANEIADPALRRLAWLSDLQYWTVLLLLDLHFRQGTQLYRDLAVAHMLGPLHSIGRYLPPLGAAVPFDPLDIASWSADDATSRLRFVSALVKEGQALAEELDLSLPPDYPRSINRETLAELEAIAAQGTHS